MGKIQNKAQNRYQFLAERKPLRKKGADAAKSAVETANLEIKSSIKDAIKTLPFSYNYFITLV